MCTHNHKGNVGDDVNADMGDGDVSDGDMSDVVSLNITVPLLHNLTLLQDWLNNIHQQLQSSAALFYALQLDGLRERAHFSSCLAQLGEQNSITLANSCLKQAHILEQWTHQLAQQEVIP